MSTDEHEVVERYRRFARDEAPGRSALYAEWAAGVAADPVTAGLLARIPAVRRQPPLVFAIARMLGAPEAAYPEWAAWLGVHIDAVVGEASRRSLQTNEPLRCAALLPALSMIPGPIALLELGASAGLCLHPDRYSYRYDGGPDLDPPTGPSPVVLSSRLTGPAAVRMPEIVWRGGIDLAPLDPRDRDDRAFLQALVWPGEAGRAERIRRALDIAAAHPAPIAAGDASYPDVLHAAVSAAPRGATLVVATPGVLPHIPRQARERLIDMLARGPWRWVTIDPAGLHDAWRPRLDAAGWGGFVLGLDARALAAVDPLGASVEWRAGSPPARG
ncbi:DUF2332 domain-containing protein [Microbacter sp. GSS18]|nr:DUF2332 domain-containing protein [Microbacter sp. GSS18]